MSDTTDRATYQRVVLSDGAASTNQASWVRVVGDVLHVYDRAPYEGGTVVRKSTKAAITKTLAPVEPRKIVCVGRNFGEHAKELGNEPPKEPLMFLKPSSSIVGDGEAVELPWQSKHVDHEAELGVVIGKSARDVAAKDALDYVFGYTAVNDITARDLQRSDGQWGRAKGFDTFCPVGPIVVTGLDPAALSIVCLVNDEVRQDDTTASMIFSVNDIIAWVSAAMTLEPGDLIAMGTPAGVSPLHDGDTVVVRIEGIGSLQNPVVARPPSK
jgi:2-keto-4-pentenoate hydratase/2-oxohepta-3-ene-1,7-dioic acid hydratase in catechol pathway